MGKRVRMLVVRDVTQLIKYERLKMQSEFSEMLTATISQDMRTPLNAIISMSKSLLPNI